jgi:putative spermidine/putrescine transport system ATP-binding protein
MYGGKIEQVGAPAEMYGSPATPFVAEFIGTMNRLIATVVKDGWIDYNGLPLRVDAAQGLPVGERVLCLVRPETVEIVAAADGAAPESAVLGEVISNTFLGSTSRVRVMDEPGERMLTADISTVRAAPLTVGTKAVASFPADSPRLLSLADEPESRAPDPDSQ